MKKTQILSKLFIHLDRDLNWQWHIHEYSPIDDPQTFPSQEQHL
jgi:hypothetical protein